MSNWLENCLHLACNVRIFCVYPKNCRTHAQKRRNHHLFLWFYSFIKGQGDGKYDMYVQTVFNTYVTVSWGGGCLYDICIVYIGWGAFKYYISEFFKILNPPTLSLHQRNQRGSRPPTTLYFADVILEHEVWVSILFRGLFPLLSRIVSGTKYHQA